jgi:hypothetical protein
MFISFSVIGIETYLEHKKKRFPTEDFDIPIGENEAFLLKEPALREKFRQCYETTRALYYQGQPSFDRLLERIGNHVERL